MGLMLCVVSRAYESHKEVIIGPTTKLYNRWTYGKSSLAVGMIGEA